MLINCAFAERVAPYMMIFRIQEEGWTEEKALEEAMRLGLPRDEMRKVCPRLFKSSVSQIIRSSDRSSRKSQSAL